MNSERRRLSLITNNCRFPVLPGCSVPNLGSRILRLTLDRLSADCRLLRQTTGRKDEEVALITSAPPERLNAQSWLCLNR